MDEKSFKNEYKSQFDSIHANDELRHAVMGLKPQKQVRAISPFKATIGTVAAAIMIFAAVHEYDFAPDTSGVISEKIVSTELPEAQFEIVEKPIATESLREITGGASGRTNTVENAVVKATKAPVTSAYKAVDAYPEASAYPTAPTEAETEAPKDSELHTPTEAMYTEDAGPRSRSGANQSAQTVEMWSVEQYYQYLGANVSAKVSGRYTGAESLEFTVDADGEPIDSTAVLPFLTQSGASLRITVSKSAFFDDSLSGNITAVGEGFNAYKISGDVYYNIYATDITEEELMLVIDAL